MGVESYSVVVIGSGFGGSIMSMVLRRMGKTVLMVEKGRHPRFAIGESSTPFANLLLEKIAVDYDLPFLRYFSEWGSWQREHPEVAGGLKRGFSFFHHRFGTRTDFQDRAKQLMVAASPNDEVADTHWYRPEFDEFLVRQAVEKGIDYLDETRVESISELGVKWRVKLSRLGSVREVNADFVIDASGPCSILADYFEIPREGFATMPRTVGVWSHFKEVQRIDALDGRFGTDVPPYPPDDAAVHHVFEGGWIWVLRFNNGITSAGAALKGGDQIKGLDAEGVWRGLLNELPTVKELFARSRAVEPFYSSPQLSFRRGRIAGRNWALLPATAGFVDPLLSTGFALNLLGIDRLASVFGTGEGWGGYELQTGAELEAAADLVSALYAKMSSPEEFNLLTLLYFAAMSFTETAWRLGKKEMADGFLLTNLRRFSSERSRICAMARNGGRIRRETIEEIIEPLDIAGLSDWTRRNWYPVNLNDLMSNGDKVGASSEDLRSLFRKLKLNIAE